MYAVFDVSVKCLPMMRTHAPQANSEACAEAACEYMLISDAPSGDGQDSDNATAGSFWIAADDDDILEAIEIAGPRTTASPAARCMPWWPARWRCCCNWWGAGRA